MNTYIFSEMYTFRRKCDRKRGDVLYCPTYVMRVTLQLFVIKSIIFNLIHFILCHIMQYPNLYQHTQDGFLKSNIVNNIFNFRFRKLQNVTRVTLELPIY